MSIGVVGLGHAFPEKILTNADLEKIVETSNEWIITRTGIRERRIAATNDGTSRWAFEAAQKALAKANLKAEDVELIVVGTTTPDKPLPSCACLIQAKLGAKKAVAFDLSAACAGFVFALSTAQQFLKNGTYRNALVIGADQISPYIDWKDRSTCVLFGDGAGACVLTQVPGKGILDIFIGSDGHYADLIQIPAGGSSLPASAATLSDKGHYLKMNGTEVFKHAVRGMTQSIHHILQKTGVTLDQIKWIIPHQANMRIIDSVAERLECSKDRIYVNLDRFGNTSAASVILAFSEGVEMGKIKKGDLVLLTTFGAGLVWGSALIEV